MGPVGPHEPAPVEGQHHRQTSAGRRLGLSVVALCMKVKMATHGTIPVGHARRKGDACLHGLPTS